jgi:hypothetical protein
MVAVRSLSHWQPSLRADWAKSALLKPVHLQALLVGYGYSAGGYSSDCGAAVGGHAGTVRGSLLGSATPSTLVPGRCNDRR